MAAPPRRGSTRSWPSISGSSPSIRKRRRSMSGATTPRRSPRPRWRRAPPLSVPPDALVHPDYPVLRAPRGFLVSYSLPPVAIALGRRALDIACAALAGRVSRGVTKLAESEVVQMAIGEAAAAIDVATMLLHTGRDSSLRRSARAAR